jgi:hypothetical protein
MIDKLIRQIWCFVTPIDRMMGSRIECAQPLAKACLFSGASLNAVVDAKILKRARSGSASRVSVPTPSRNSAYSSGSGIISRRN